MPQPRPTQFGPVQASDVRGGARGQLIEVASRCGRRRIRATGWPDLRRHDVHGACEIVGLLPMTDTQGATTPIDIELDSSGRRLRFAWADGHKSDYDWEYLRWRCPCAYCSGEGEFPGVLKTKTSMTPEEIEMIDIELVGRYAVQADLARQSRHGHLHFPRAARARRTGRISPDGVIFFYELLFVLVAIVAVSSASCGVALAAVVFLGLWFGAIWLGYASFGARLAADSGITEEDRRWYADARDGLRHLRLLFGLAVLAALAWRLIAG